MYPLIIKVLIAHLLGDFVLQSDKMVNDIHSKKIKSKYLYGHFFIHYILLLLVTGFKKEFVIPALFLALVHLIIDIMTKTYLAHKISSLLNLMIDQSLHFISIALFIYYYYPYSIAYSELFSPKIKYYFCH